MLFIRELQVRLTNVSTGQMCHYNICQLLFAYLQNGTGGVASPVDKYITKGLKQE